MATGDLISAQSPIYSVTRKPKKTVQSLGLYSKVAFEKLVSRSVGVPGTADFSSGSVLNLVTTLTFNSPHADKPTIGVPLISIYQGTTLSSANRIYPIRGANVTVGRYTVFGEADKLSYNGTAINWSGMIIDTTGVGTQVVSFDADWLYVDYIERKTQ